MRAHGRAGWRARAGTALRPHLRAQEKFYFTDPVYTRLVPAQSQDLTALSEQQLGMALLRGMERDEPGSFVSFDQLLHHRTATRAEIDFVGPGLDGAALLAWLVDV